jgi:hypothetical protein
VGKVGLNLDVSAVATLASSRALIRIALFRAALFGAALI